jgi:hypothetical protein
MAKSQMTFLSRQAARKRPYDKAVSPVRGLASFHHAVGMPIGMHLPGDTSSVAVNLDLQLSRRYLGHRPHRIVPATIRRLHGVHRRSCKNAVRRSNAKKRLAKLQRNRRRLQKRLPQTLSKKKRGATSTNRSTKESLALTGERLSPQILPLPGDAQSWSIR